MCFTNSFTLHTTLSNTGLLRLTAFLSLVTLVKTSPVTSRWLRPCDARTSVPVDFINLPNHPITPVNDHLDNVITLLRSSTQDLRQLMDDYVRRRFSGSYEVVRSMEGWRIDGLPNVGNEVGGDMELEAFLRQSYNHYVRVIVFLQEAIADEMTYEAPYQTSFHETYERYLQRHAYDVLCHLHIMSNQHDLDLSVTVTESVMSDSLREIEARENRHKRDYVVLREFHKLALHFFKSLSIYKTNIAS